MPTGDPLNISSANIGGQGVTSIVAGTNVTISPTTGKGAVTVNASGGGGGGVTSIIAGSGITVSGATGDVTVTATGTGTNFKSSDIVIGQVLTQWTVAHGLGVVPSKVRCVVKCISNDATSGLVSGQEVDVKDWVLATGGPLFSVVSDGTNIQINSVNTWDNGSVDQFTFVAPAGGAMSPGPAGQNLYKFVVYASP